MLSLPTVNDRTYEQFQAECRQTSGQFKVLAERSRTGEMEPPHKSVEFLVGWLMYLSLMLEGLVWSDLLDREWLQRIWTVGDA